MDQPLAASRHSPLRARPARLAYALGATLFVGCVVLQVFLAGLGTLVSFGDFDLHRTWGELIAWTPLVMLATGLAGRLPWRTLALTALLFGLYVMQWVFIFAPFALGMPELRALHAVNALAIFWVALHLARASWRLLRPDHVYPAGPASVESEQA